MDSDRLPRGGSARLEQRDLYALALDRHCSGIHQEIDRAANHKGEHGEDRTSNDHGPRHKGVKKNGDHRCSGDVPGTLPCDLCPELTESTLKFGQILKLNRALVERQRPPLRDSDVRKTSSISRPRIDLWSRRERFQPTVERCLVEIHHLGRLIDSPDAVVCVDRSNDGHHFNPFECVLESGERPDEESIADALAGQSGHTLADHQRYRLIRIERNGRGPVIGSVDHCEKLLEIW